jgi:hypothetical protein
MHKGEGILKGIFCEVPTPTLLPELDARLAPHGTGGVLETIREYAYTAETSTHGL